MPEELEKPLVSRRWNLSAWLDDVQAALPPEEWAEIIAAAQSIGLTGDIKQDADLIKIHKYMFIMDRLHDYIDF